MKITIQNNKLCVKLSKIEQLFAVKRSFCMPLADVEGIIPGRPDFSIWEFRAPGLHLPYVIKTGTYYTLRGKEFWYVRRGENPITIELNNQPYKRIILSLGRSEEEAEVLDKKFQLGHAATYGVKQ